MWDANAATIREAERRSSSSFFIFSFYLAVTSISEVYNISSPALR